MARLGSQEAIVQGIHAGQSINPGHWQSYKSANEGRYRRDTMHRGRLSLIGYSVFKPGLFSVWSSSH